MGWGTPGFVPPEAAFTETLAEPSADIVALGAILATVALKPGSRESTVFAHKVRLRVNLVPLLGLLSCLKRAPS